MALDGEVEADYADREEFVVDRLGVPRQWVAVAKAVLARGKWRPRDRALLYWPNQNLILLLFSMAIHSLFIDHNSNG